MSGMTNEDDQAMDRVILPSLETPTLTKAELAELLFERLGLNKRESKDMVEAFFEIVHVTLVSGDDVKLSGFGNFNIRRKAPRPGRNPRRCNPVPPDIPPQPILAPTNPGWAFLSKRECRSSIRRRGAGLR